jgi:hypothetical protein
MMRDSVHPGAHFEAAQSISNPIHASIAPLSNRAGPKYRTEPMDPQMSMSKRAPIFSVLFWLWWLWWLLLLLPLDDAVVVAMITTNEEEPA